MNLEQNDQNDPPVIYCSRCALFRLQVASTDTHR